MRNLAIGSNIKMYLGYHDTLAWMKKLVEFFGLLHEIELFIFVPAICLVDAQRILRDTSIGYGAQNMHWADAGPYTGELSAKMLKEVGCTYVELGHMERRRYFGENDREVNLKLRQALKTQLRAVVCIGEEQQATEKEVTQKLTDQLSVLLTDIHPEDTKSFLLAYEPAWAIGVEEPAPASYVINMVTHLRNTVSDLLGQKAAEELKIIYGGSVNLNIVRELLQSSEIDGLFVGRSALNPEYFKNIIMEAKRIKEDQYEKNENRHCR